MKQWIVSLCLLLPVCAWADRSDLTIIPKGELPTTVPEHGSVNISYTVTNTTSRTLQNIGLRPAPYGHTPEGVSQIFGLGNCPDPFTLKADESCNLLLMVKADDMRDGRAQGGPEVCNSSPPPVRCSIPFPKDVLNLRVVERPAAPPEVD